MLCLQWHRVKNGPPPDTITIPNRTYISVPMQIKLAGYKVKFHDTDWKGIYQLEPLRVFDAARRFRANMFPINNRGNTYMCTSHHWTKILGIQHGGCILHDDPKADRWFRKARFDGRTDYEDIADCKFDVLGYHCPMPPENAAAGLVRLANLGMDPQDLPNSNYPDLSRIELFK